MLSLEAIRAEHDEFSVLIERLRTFGDVPLACLVDRLRVLCNAPNDCLSEPRWWRLLAHELDAFRDRLERHLHDEEQGRYMGEVIAAHPEYEHRAESLQGEHAGLIQHTQELAIAVRQRRDLGDIRGQIVRLLDVIEEHEHAEHQLIQESMDLDG